MNRFYVLSGPRAGFAFDAGDKRLVVGRDPECDIAFDDDRMSRKHFALAMREGRVAALDLGSSNGTFVNGELVAERTLEDGDVLVAGSTKIRFGAPRPAGAAPPKEKAAPGAGDTIVFGAETLVADDGDAADLKTIVLEPAQPGDADAPGARTIMDSPPPEHADDKKVAQASPLAGREDEVAQASPLAGGEEEVALAGRESREQERHATGTVAPRKGPSGPHVPAPPGTTLPFAPAQPGAAVPHAMDKQRLEQLRDKHRDDLLGDTLPFWLGHAVDRECGGFFTFLERDGAVFGTDKPGWIQNRFVWLLSLLWSEAEQRDEWLQAARHGVEFIERYLFDADGRMFFLVTRDGRPLRKRRYVVTEMFGAIAFSEFARATGDERRLDKARQLYRLAVDCTQNPNRLPPKFVPGTRPMKSHGSRMCLLATTQQLRKHGADPLLDEVADQAVFEILNHFMREDEQALLENVGPDGERLDGPEGRCVNPGHAIETAWFLMEESRQRNRPELVAPALKILDWSLERGWDAECGGILYFADVEGKPCVQYEHDMKLWWPHTEALYATLLALHLTGERRYADWHEKIYDWAYARFPDREHGEWFKYLHRDGTVSVTLKGNGWAGPFHLPRMQFCCWKLLEEMLGG